MICYPLNQSKLQKDIDKIDPRWSFKTKRRIAKFIKTGGYAEKSSLWSIVKPVYMKVQFNKCVFCERQFENEQYGKIEFDLEHFRPKSSVTEWPDRDRHPNMHYQFSTGERSENGYYWLAYDTSNYAASCKVCNSALKSNYFPIAGDRALPLATADALKNEKPFLCYPLGNGDIDPERLVTFSATTARPEASAEHEKRRGQIIIDFFDLNGRELLHRQRAQMISLVGGALAAEHSGKVTQADRAILSKIGDPSLPHASCIRAHRLLWQTDPTQASRVYDQCRELAVEQTTMASPEL